MVTKVRSGPFRYPESPFRYSESPFRYQRKSVSVPRESVSVLRESVSVSTKVRFGPFRSVSVPREFVSVLRESVSVSTKVRFGPFRSVSVPRESVSVLRESVSVSTKVRFGPFRSVSVRSGPFRYIVIPTDTYILQANRASFNQYAVDPTCKVCQEEPEDRVYFIARCESLDHVREPYKHKLENVFMDIIPNVKDDMIFT